MCRAGLTFIPQSVKKKVDFAIPFHHTAMELSRIVFVCLFLFVAHYYFREDSKVLAMKASQTEPSQTLQ